jgi:hypothetical protein
LVWDGNIALQVIKEYMKKSILMDNPVQNCKYVIKVQFHNFIFQTCPKASSTVVTDSAATPGRSVVVLIERLLTYQHERKYHRTTGEARI